ncbi:MAG: tRNA (guanosine(37)-N1)-methyltransferase TrmD [Deltaproteobacteria bacterium]|nr:tRNA (guanosine(37)-N1)-methyltransferase TrmD [Deltaproteobacteria bacterium]
MRFDILTLFPDFFISPLRQSITGRAIERGIIDVRTHNIRDYTTDKHRTTDDYPYGGGAGMVMKAEPVVRALEGLGAGGARAGRAKAGGAGRRKVLLTTPQGVPFSHGLAVELSALDEIIIVCGRYEGFDERIRTFADMEVSAGDYVLTGGEIPALLIVDAVSRLLPGVLGEESSATDETFSRGLLEYPQYTRPEEFRSMKVPDVLLSGNHREIERWRRAQSIIRTYSRRPELLEMADLSEEDRRLIEVLKKGI